MQHNLNVNTLHIEQKSSGKMYVMYLIYANLLATVLGDWIPQYNSYLLY